MKNSLVAENNNTEYQERSYDELSSEFQSLYPSVARAFQLIPQMYNRLTLVDKLSHKSAMKKMYSDHKHLPGFSRRNIRRNLPLDNSSVPRRIRSSWPKDSPTETNEKPKFSSTTQKQNQDVQTNNYEEIIPVVNDQIRKRHNTEPEPCDKCAELKEALSRQTALISANDISAYEIKFTIPKEKYPNLNAAI